MFDFDQSPVAVRGRGGPQKRGCLGVILTDLDGSLLSETYGIGPAFDALARADSLGVPICPCSSKTSAEIQRVTRSLGIRDPFISENGGAIFAPLDYFEAFPVRPRGHPIEYEVIELGRPYRELIAELQRVSRKSRLEVHGFHELTAAAVSARTGLPLAEAGLALERHHDLPFWLEREEDIGRLKKLLADGFTITQGGQYFHLTGSTDKGRAVRELLNLYRRHYPRLRTAGIGDSENDASMLLQVETPILVQRRDGTYDSQVSMRVPNVRRADGVGPAGWRSAVHALLDDWMSTEKTVQ